MDEYKDDIMHLQQISGIELPEPSYNMEFDSQIVTARRYPRIITQAYDKIKAIVTISLDTAISCGYMVPKGDKEIRGPSVHLARIIAQNWGNLRVSQNVIGEDGSFVIAEATAWDLESNFAIRTQIKRRIVDKTGKRYNLDLIQTTGNAAMAIAFRNSLFAVIPKSIVDGTYDLSRKKITGDLSDPEKLSAKRLELFLIFEKRYKVSSSSLLKFLRVANMTDVTQAHILKLIELDQSFKDGDADPRNVFSESFAERADKVTKRKPPKTDSKLVDKKPMPPKAKENDGKADQPKA